MKAVLATLAGKCILVVEDETIIALDLQLTLGDHGASVAGPFGGAPEALARIDGAVGVPRIDAAVLDVSLGDHTCEVIAARLRELGVPFVLHSGDWLAADELVTSLGAPVIRKPATTDEVIQAIAALLS